MSSPSIDQNFFAAFFQQISQFYSMYNVPQQTNFLQQSYGIYNPEAVNTSATAGVSTPQENQAFVVEVMKMQIAAAIRNAQIQGKPVADYAQFLDPSKVPTGPGVQNVDLTQWAGDTSAVFGYDRSFVSQDLRLGSYDLLVSSNLGLHAPDIMGPWGTKSQELFLGNRVTGNGMLIDGDSLKTMVNGVATATGSLKDILKISATNKTGTINLENGTKMTFSYEVPDGGVPKLDKIFVNHVDGSFAELKATTDAAGKISYATETGQRTEDLMAFQDSLVKDGTSLFLTPEGASLQALSPLSGEFTGVFGDPRALQLGMRAASFGGNIYNYFYSATDQGFHAEQAIPQFVSFAGGQWPDLNGFPSEFPDDSNCAGGFMPVNCPPGFTPPPQSYQPGSSVIGSDSIEDLIMEDMTGKDPTGTLQAAKNSFLKYQMKYGRMDFETKLMVILYLFLEDNTKETDDIFKKLSGLDENDMANGTKATKQTFNKTSIENGSIKDQIDFWSNYKPSNLSTNDNRRNEQLSSNATMVNGKLKSLEVDQSLLQARLTNLIRDRQRMVETITNAMKALDDAMANTVRRIV